VPAEKISVEEALKSHTVCAAYASFVEKVKGSIETGKLADFVVLDQNIFEIPRTQIRNVKVLRTVVGGKAAYSAD